MVVVSRSEKPEEFSRRLWYLNLEEDTIQVVGKDAVCVASDTRAKRQLIRRAKQAKRK